MTDTPHPAFGEALEALVDQVKENRRLRAEVASLRASLGEPTGAEPVGCPCPGACSAVTAGYLWLRERAAEGARREREEKE